jgi:hypothetical protein
VASPGCALSANVEQVCTTPGPPPANDPFLVHLSAVDRGTSTSTYQHLVLSIAADEASPDASAFSSNFDYALAHPQEKVLSPDENAGYQLFRGKGLCNMCHLDGTQNTAAVKYTSCLRKREDLNNDLPAFNSDTSWTLPMPGRFVIGQDRVIRYAEINPDYTHRPEPADMLSTLRSIRVTRGA